MAVMVNKTFFHILYSKKDNMWHIKKNNENTITSHNSKPEAIENAMFLAESVKGLREIIVHKTNGTFESVNKLAKAS